jgi:hypothetical protein
MKFSPPFTGIKFTVGVGGELHQEVLTHGEATDEYPPKILEITIHTGGMQLKNIRNFAMMFLGTSYRFAKMEEAGEMPTEEDRPKPRGGNDADALGI